MIFIETPLFTKLVRELLSDEQYRGLQRTLVLRPDAGAVIRESGGLRKVRWNVAGSGKRGGMRIIYYWDVPNETIYMLLIFKKNRQEDLTREQLKILRNLIKEWLQ
jgi:mRNA-degrading endonuclease RelE of RelBE toxin-antitoxin system